MTRKELADVFCYAAKCGTEPRIWGMSSGDIYELAAALLDPSPELRAKQMEAALAAVPDLGGYELMGGDMLKASEAVEDYIGEMLDAADEVMP